MTRFFQFIERKPLGLSVLAFVVSLPVLGLSCLPAYSGPPMQLAFDWGAVVLCCFAFAIGLLAVVNLIRAERRGYSSTRIGLSVAVLFFAFVPVILFALKLLALYVRDQ